MKTASIKRSAYAGFELPETFSILLEAGQLLHLRDLQVYLEKEVAGCRIALTTIPRGVFNTAKDQFLLKVEQNKNSEIVGLIHRYIKEKSNHMHVKCVISYSNNDISYYEVTIGGIMKTF